MWFKSIIFLLMLLVTGCSSYSFNGGMEQFQQDQLTKFPKGTVTLISYRTTQWWDIFDSWDKAWVVVMPDGTVHFYPLAGDDSTLLKNLGTIGQMAPTPVAPLTPVL